MSFGQTVFNARGGERCHVDVFLYRLTDEGS